MIKEFCFFIFLAAICFSGLLFTLWKLGASPALSIHSGLFSQPRSRRDLESEGHRVCRFQTMSALD